MFEAGAIAYRLQTVGAEVFARDVDRADKSVERLGRTSELSGRRMATAGKQVRDFTGDVQRFNGQDLSAVGRTFIGAGLAVAAMVTLSVVKFAEYDKALDSLGANADVQGEKLDELGEAAIQSGRQFGYTANEAIEAEEALAKAGVSISDILGGSLVGSLTLAAAGNLGVAESAEIASIAMTQFKKEGKDVPHIADLLAAGAGKAVGDVDDLAMALKQGGLVSSQFGISLEETVGTLAAFASAGLLGSDAGTSYKTMLLSLAAPQGKAAALMDELGIVTTDASGKFIGITGLAGVLREKLGGLSEAQRNAALATIFGTDAIRAASVLYDQGAEGIAKWVENVDDTGYAAEQARKKLDNLNGDLGKLGASFDNALIQNGSAANEVLRDMVQAVTEIIDWYAELDPVVHGGALAFGVGTAAALLFTGVLFTGVPRVLAFKEAMRSLNLEMGKMALVGGGATLALTALVFVLGAMANANADARAKAEAYGDTLDAVTNKITKATREFAKENLSDRNFFGGDSAFDAAEKLGLSLDVVTDAATGNASALRALQNEVQKIENMSADEKVAKFGSNWALAEAQINQVVDAVKGENESLDEAIRVAEQKQSVDADTVDSNGDVADSYDGVTAQVDALVSSLQDLATEIAEANGQQLDAREAARQLEEAYDDFDAAVKENGQTLDTTTEAGRENQAALDAIAQAALDAGQAIIDSGGSYEDYKNSLESSREQLLQRINDLGISGDAAEELADQILNIPSATEWQAIVKLEEAQAAIDAFLARNQGIRIGVGTFANKSLVEADGGIVKYFANGGTEHHVAQIERAGAMRVWAEPETGGETYIPHAIAKRGRSTQILAQTADEFGYQLVPKGAQSFADGGMSASPVERSRSPKPLRIEGRIEFEGGLFGTLRGHLNDGNF